MSERLRVRRDGAVCTLELHRPEKRNALDGRMIEDLTDALGNAGADESVRVIALRGAGPDFCGGADLAELARISEMDHADNLKDAQRLGELFLSLRRVGKPVVAVVHGRALAGGAGLATAADVLIAHEDARFGYPEVHLGFVPAIVMAILKRRIPEGKAFELLARGHQISAAEGLDLGLVTRVFPALSFDEEVRSYLQELAGLPPTALELLKGLFYELDEVEVEKGIARGAEVNAQARRTEACREGVRAFLERSRS